MSGIVGEAYEFFRLAHAMVATPIVLLVGYSRGGAGVVDLARRLKAEGITVHGMVLFDPVDRSGATEGYDVPNNVLQMVQARRATMTLSRISFNNCATVWHPPTKCERQFFWATHGGLGGVPWNIKPGFGPRDYIDENKWNMETGLSSTVYDVLRFRWRKPDDYQGTLEELRTRRHELLGDRTQVTYEEDVAGAEKVWHWVQPRLQHLGFLSTKS
jgi:pimeloyl-ACP methyl ester carboxylesterase